MSKVVAIVGGGLFTISLVMAMIVICALMGSPASRCQPAAGGPLPTPPAGQLGAGGAVRYLERAGESAAAAGGMVGNLEQESGLDPTESDGAGGGGLAQWSATWYHVQGPGGTRSLDAFAGSRHTAPNTDRAQLAFIVYDLRSADSWLQSRMDAAPDAQTAATMFETGYERCRGVTGFMAVTPGSPCSDPRRREYAVAALHAAGTGTGGGTGGGTGIAVPVSDPVSGGCSGPVSGPAPITDGPTAKILPSGIAVVPAKAPAAVKEMIAAGNRLIDTFYSQERRPGMLSQVEDSYDCSGTVDFVLYNSGFAASAAVDPYATATAGDSSDLESFGDPGAGRWVDVYGSTNHAFIVIAGVVLDTSHYGSYEPTTVPYDPEPGDTVLGGPTSGPRWFPAGQMLASQLADGNTWTRRHPDGL